MVILVLQGMHFFRTCFSRWCHCKHILGTQLFIIYL